jgi:hypothetical protein
MLLLALLLRVMTGPERLRASASMETAVEFPAELARAAARWKQEAAAEQSMATAAGCFAEPLPQGQ